MWCPRCDQGNIVKATILKNGEQIRICEECDAMWKAGDEVSDETFTDYSSYVEPLGLKGLWTELAIFNE